MARADLSAMLGRLEEVDSIIDSGVKGEEPPIEQAGPKSVKRKSARSNSDPQLSDGAAGARSKDSKQPAGPLYMRLERKETRLRSDQYARLTEYSRALSRAKNEGGERITENTLIRVAIDLLLERADKLQGSNEAELRKSVSS
ncbi:hypothetical protein [Subtercola boreus]|uniref:hypothetical protein n=1 Tax=Subtercola boreus TaxID=120213 RepID=UPI001C0F157D|nr:hypothetical protein [Subtercola boreus]